MVEFVRKTLAEKDCTLDATYNDLYDGTNPYLKVGGIMEPKKSLFRFKIADKPTYGDAILAGGEVGLYATGMNMGNTATYPTYNFYKLKTSPEGLDWGGEGKIRTIPRGKQIVGLNSSAALGQTWASDDTVKVIGHGLETGDKISWSPCVVRYDDCDIQPLKPEVTYFIIKVDRDNFYFADTLSDAIDGIPVSLNDTASNHTPNPTSDSDGPWGYIRSEKYTQDIHVVSAVHDLKNECVAENFNGSAYREDDLDFVPVQRTVTRQTTPYLVASGLSALKDNPHEDASQGKEGKGAWLKFGALGIEDEHHLGKWYGNGKKRHDPDFKVSLTSHKTESDGSGWWRTVKDAGKWGGGHDYIEKGSSHVKFNEEQLVGAEPYGDEVTPANSIFHRVKGAAEFQKAADTEDGENELQATGAIRFSSKKKMTGGQSCNIYQFWKQDAIGVSYDNNGGDNPTDDRQECMMLYKGIPFPTHNTAEIAKGQLPHGKYPINNSSDTDKGYGEEDLCVSMTVNFNKLEKAFSFERNHGSLSSQSADTDNITMRRGFHVIFANSPPRVGEQLYDYAERLSGDDRVWNDDDGITALGYSIVNTNAGIRVIAGQNWTFDNTAASVGDLGYDLYENTTNDETNTSLPHGSYMEEGEWYNIKVFFPTATDADAALIIENQDNEGVHVKNSNSNPSDVMIAKRLSNLNDDGGTAWYAQQPSSSNAMSEEWPQHMSIWVTNTKSAYTTGTYTGTDWMADKEDRDTCNDIFIDRISVNGVNLDHENATVGQNGSRSKIYIQGSKLYNSSGDGGGSVNTTSIPYHYDERQKGSYSYISLGFEDPSQILSNHLRQKSWRYLFWNGYQSANISADNKIGWTADDTLPLTTYCETGTDSVQEWFTPLPDHSFRTYGDSSTHHVTNGALDAGLPFTYVDLGAGQMQELAPAIRTWYSDDHVTPGAQCSFESLDTRDLYISRTKDADTAGHIGAKQPMFTTCPSIGATFHGVSGVTTKQITILSGPNDGDGVYWNSGQRVVYYSNNLVSCGNITSATGFFNDTPTVYYWERSSDTTGYLHAAFTDAVAGESATRINVTDGGSGNHILYTYEYYSNRKYFTDGFSSKGVTQMILEPVQYNGGSATTSLNKKFLDTDELSPVQDVSGTLKTYGGATTLSDISTISDLDLTKRENAFCAAKVLEVVGAVKNQHTGSSGITKQSIKMRVDTVKPLRSTPGTTYRAWLAGGADNTASYASNLYVNIVDSEHIEVMWDGTADGGAVMTDTVGADGASGTATSTGLARLWIGPEKYWIGMVIRNQSGDSNSTEATLPLKTYNSVCVVAPFDTDSADASNNQNYHTYHATEYDAWGEPGATYNESTYSAEKVSGIRGAYVNQWQPSPDTDPNRTIYDLADYGFGGPKNDEDGNGGENGVIGGYTGKFIPRINQVNRIKMPKLFESGEKKKEGEYIDLALQQETLSSDAILTVASTDNGAYPTPFLLTNFEDPMPAHPTLKIKPYEIDPFYPEFSWEASEGDLWYGFIMLDDVPIDNQYHRSLLHVPFNEDLRSKASAYDDTKGWEYWKVAGNTVEVYGHRYGNTSKYGSGVHAGSALASSGTENVAARSFKAYNNVEGLAGNCMNFKYRSVSVLNASYNNGTTITHTSIHPDAVRPGQLVTGTGIPNGAYVASVSSATQFVLSAATTGGSLSSQTLTLKDGGYAEFNFDTTAGSSDFSYPIDEMSVVVHVSPSSWGSSTHPERYICSFNEPEDLTTTKDSWGIYLDENGKVNAYVAGVDAANTTTHPTSKIVTVQSTSKLPIDSTPTSIILTVDTQLHHGNVKLYINGKLEDQSGIRKTTGTSNNWQTDADGLGGEPIFYDSNGTENLYIGAKSSLTSNGVNNGILGFQGKIEEFVWYDKCIYPIVPSAGKLLFEKPLAELAEADSASSKSYIARLFVKDYHNIRGKTTGEIAASPQVSYKKAAFPLKTN